MNLPPLPAILETMEYLNYACMLHHPKSGLKFSFSMDRKHDGCCMDQSSNFNFLWRNCSEADVFPINTKPGANIFTCSQTKSWETSALALLTSNFKMALSNQQCLEFTWRGYSWTFQTRLQKIVCCHICWMFLLFKPGVIKRFDLSAEFARLPGHWRVRYSAIYIIYAKLGC